MANDYQRVVHFPNGYGASVICNDHSYGHGAGLFEVAILRGDSICYDTEMLPCGVEGWLDFDDVSRLLGRIAALPACVKAEAVQ